MTYRTSSLHVHPYNFDEVAPSLELVEYPVERFDYRQGLNSLQVHSCVIAPDGRLWAASPIGLICYNGVRFQTFGQKQGLASHGLRALSLHPESGELWIGTDLGVEVLNINGGAPMSVWSDSMGTVNCFALTRQRCFIGSSLGLFEWDKDQGIHRSSLAQLNQDTIEHLLSGHSGNVWSIGSASGLGLISGENHFTKMTIANLIGKPRCMALGPNKKILVGGIKGVSVLGPDETSEMLCETPAPVDALLWERDDIWMSHGEELACLQTHMPDNTKTRPVLADTKIKHILRDRFDNIWLSTSGMGLLRISSFRNTLVEGFPTEAGSILSVHVRGADRLIGGSKGLVLPRGDVILNNLEVWDVLQDDDGRIWSATDKGLYLTPNPHLSVLYRPEDCPVTRAPCRALIQFKQQVYVASIRGLAHICANGVKEVLDPEGQSFGYVYSLHVSAEGYLWIATLGRGVYRFDGSEVVPYPVKDIPSTGNVYAMTQDAKGRIYFACNNKIIRQDSPDNFTTIVDSDDPIAAWSISWLDNGTLAAGTSKGLIIYDSETGQIRHQISGLFEDIPWEFTTSRSLAVIDSSTLFCGLGSGLRTVQLDNLLQRNDAPIAMLGSINWRSVNPEIHGKEVIVPTGNWHVQVDLSTEWFLDECKMRYKLEGFDEDWSDLTRLGPIRYTSLPAGDYTFRVILHSTLAGIGPEAELLNFKVI